MAVFSKRPMRTKSVAQSNFKRNFYFNYPLCDMLYENGVDQENKQATLGRIQVNLSMKITET